MDTWEHKWIVDEACRTRFGGTINVVVGKEKFTLGEISSLAADYLAAPGDLLADPKRAKTFLKEHKQQLDRKDSISETDSGIYSQGKYFDLALKNYQHFRRGRTTIIDQEPAPENALSMLRYYHYEARRIYKSGFAHLHRAYIYEGFALHFLIDLCAAGHMRTPRAAFYRHFREILGYDEENAHIIGAVLSLYQHDVDNEKGLLCRWISTEKVTAWGFVDYEKSWFYGDKSSGLNCSKTDVHIYNVVMADIMHAFSSLRSFWLRDMYAKDCPWKTYKRDVLLAEFYVTALGDESQAVKDRKVEEIAAKFDDLPQENDDENYDDFLKYCIPTVLPANRAMHFGFDDGRDMVDEDEARWMKSDLDVFRVYEDKVEVRLEKDDEGFIQNVHITIYPDASPAKVYVYTGLGTVALAPMMPLIAATAGGGVTYVNAVRTELSGDSEDVPKVFRAIRWWYTWKLF